ncbi:MAG: HAMP domain-containing sensor histidine kinase, partial [Planctomycetota bacterium]
QQDNYYRALIRESGLGSEFEWYAILPQEPTINPNGANPPQFKEEAALLKNTLRRLSPQDGQETAEPVDPLALPKGHHDGIRAGGDKYFYYQPIYATSACILCHRVLGAGGPRPHLAEGDLMAIMRIEVDRENTVRVLSRTDALAWVAAVVIGFLSMFLLYFIVRYVIVKPVQHLRDVANAVREGDVDTRAEIHTGDEFEELAAAFNRMVRRLLRQQNALQSVNGELDAKIDELAQANMRLFEMNRVKSDFLATMSHELRTPLNSILGFSDVLGAIDALDSKQQRYVTNIQRSGRLLLEMINDILDLAKMESGKMEVRPSDFRVDTVASAQCDLARPLSEKKNIDLVFTAEANLPPMRQDQAKVQQVLNNLLSNAIKFTPEGGRITVRAEREADPLGRGAGTLQLTVQDTGVGISEADQAVIFEKFRQGAAATPDGDAMTREFSGTGLGLSIVRELCRLLGGEVTLDSTVGKGSTFIVQLPWTLSESKNLDIALEKGVAELTRPPALAVGEGI